MNPLVDLSTSEVPYSELLSPGYNVFPVSYKGKSVTALPFVKPISRTDNRYWSVPPVKANHGLPEHLSAVIVGAIYAAHFVQFLADNPDSTYENDLSHVFSGFWADQNDDSIVLAHRDNSASQWEGFSTLLTRYLKLSAEKGNTDVWHQLEIFIAGEIEADLNAIYFDNTSCEVTYDIWLAELVEGWRSNGAASYIPIIQWARAQFPSKTNLAGKATSKHNNLSTAETLMQRWAMVEDIQDEAERQTAVTWWRARTAIQHGFQPVPG